MADSIELQHGLSKQGYIADEQLAASLYLMQKLQKPLLVEGEAGVGKTDIAKHLAKLLNAELIRLQCYEGLTAEQAIYEWNYKSQLLAAQRGNDEHELYSEQYLLERPLLKAIRSDKVSVLLIDEIDRADEEFEALLLELLAEFTITIPELHTIRANVIPLVVLTSNGVRELSDALRRRCLYHYVDFPDFKKELAIVRAKLPEIEEQLATQIVRFVQSLRNKPFRKIPGVAETLDWASALTGLTIDDLHEHLKSDPSVFGCLAKTQEDVQLLRKTIGV